MFERIDVRKNRYENKAGIKITQNIYISYSSRHLIGKKCHIARYLFLPEAKTNSIFIRSTTFLDAGG